MEKIKMRTSGLPVDGRRAAPPDMDHAVKILEMTKRGYHVNVSSDDTPWWSVSAYYMPDRVFVNQPEGTTGTLIVKENYGNDNALLYDDWPDWMMKIIRLIRAAAPDTLHISAGISTDTPTEEQSDG